MLKDRIEEALRCRALRMAHAGHLRGRGIRSGRRRSGLGMLVLVMHVLIALRRRIHGCQEE